jgi:hypothetical protein
VKSARSTRRRLGARTYALGLCFAPLSACVCVCVRARVRARGSPRSSCGSVRDEFVTSQCGSKMAASDTYGDDSLYPIAVLIDELKNEDVQVRGGFGLPGSPPPGSRVPRMLPRPRPPPLTPNPYPILSYPTLPYSTLLCSPQLYPTLPYPTQPYSTQPYSTLLYSTLPCITPLRRSGRSGPNRSPSSFTPSRPLPPPTNLPRSSLLAPSPSHTWYTHTCPYILLTYLPTYLHYLPLYLSTFLLIYISTCLSAYLPICLSA